MINKNLIYFANFDRNLIYFKARVRLANTKGKKAKRKARGK